MIQLLNVGKTYNGGNDGLRNVSLDIAQGEFCYLVGHSGAGKSTLLRLLGLLERPSRGQIVVDGRQLARFKRTDVPLYRRSLGMIFQDHRLLADRSAFDNVAMPLLVSEISTQEIRKRVRAALDKVALLHKEQALAASLSSGEQQRVGIARAVVARPQILLADEPTGNLDAELSREIFALFDQFNQVGVTIIIATHDRELVELFPRRTIELKQGQVVADTGHRL